MMNHTRRKRFLTHGVTLVWLLCLLCIPAVLGEEGGDPPCMPEISLPSNPSTGYNWKAVSGDESILLLNESYAEQSEEEKPLVGAPTTYLCRLEGQKSGMTTATFIYERSWEPSESDQKLVFTVMVDDDLNVLIYDVQMGTRDGQ